ncbi:hypothetical protein [Pseudofrankia asymbiotica]|nr:hypothetical protein [Pseudofrankia asymbiotica]
MASSAIWRFPGQTPTSRAALAGPAHGAFASSPAAQASSAAPLT